MKVNKFFKKATHVLLVAGLTIGLTAPFTGNSVQAAADTVPIQILGINDFHGALETASKDASGSPIGGADYLATNLDNATSSFLQANPDATADNAIRVQAGDMVGASPAVSGLLQDEPTMKVLQKMNFEVGTLGNHEFDEGLPEYKRILDGVSTSKFGPIVEAYPRVKSDMKIVAANVVNKGTNTVAEGFSPYYVKEIDGVKVGFIGIVTTEIPNLVLANHIKDYDFLDEAETIVKYSAELRGQGVNAIVVLSHVPALSTGNPNTGTKQDVAGEAANMITKANELDPNNSVDLVLAGHNHQYTNGLVGKTRIVQSYNNGKAFSDVTGELDKTTGDFVSPPDAKITYNTRSVSPNADITAVTEDAKSRIEGVINETIGLANKDVISRDTNLDNKAIDDKESELGNMITDAQRYMANKAGADVDFAMTNNGGIRADLSTRLANSQNEITWGAAQAVQPFGNILQVVEMSGADILEALNQQYLSNQTYFLQISGLKYTFTDTDDLDHAYKVASVTTENGTPLKADQKYKVVINDFLFGGGDGFSAFKKANLVTAIDPDTETFINYIKDQKAAGKVITAQKEGRKVYKSQADIDKETEAAAIQAIKDATKINKLAEKDKTLTGTTLPGATVGVQKADTNAKLARATGPSTTADANGKFSVDISSLDLKKGDQFTTTVTDANGYSTTFQTTVQATATTPPDNEDGNNSGTGNGNGSNGGANNGNTNNGSGTTDGGTTTTETPTTSAPNGTTTGSKVSTTLPTTGDTAGLATVFGLVLTTTALYVLRKKN
ncbi:5'-nucleotidase C-terminal domain-containing protein [Listeria ivanovii]|uniref:5'-nucleotidase, putative peptidoglycan bound protein (LPXTG motif) n=1 Tax=Listeria ivanovii (strain ATCC BAA-678 / PAM 55) TaxID=881621 RepID=G2Z9D2_LISIP|nr:bifunctional metallophosphatase/5'-nucleotidase [Listeria ivanovii]AHI54729.1 5'-nucleotidase [Listeria ivanovii WSLC3009]MBC1760641.1 bifunctional metallophosphatase/5'-nucleotidase [Listeria ivanovii]MCJ1718683.1 5'-nucleotidase C-terminal domain-containing protein [Listeria ivanovii]MCJ1736555.1 5'-nucleotidase C-terminal domain-containing protein [Listeria ivanovii]PZG51567.1 bifunctional metallophosphatase/5'-nucleotidase [Listeria ivanovii]